MGPTGSPPLRLHAPETGRERQEWGGGREASEARRPNPLQTAALALHEVLSNENCHCKKKKKNQGKGRVKETRTKTAVLMKTGARSEEKQGLQVQTLISRYIGGEKFQSIIIRRSWPALLAGV